MNYEKLEVKELKHFLPIVYEIVLAKFDNVRKFKE